MEQIKKLFRKINQKERRQLLAGVQKLQTTPEQCLIVKIKGTSNQYRVRIGRFRVIFHYTSTGEIELDTVRLRDEKTYRDF